MTEKTEQGDYKERKHPDFPEWIKSQEGRECVDFNNLTEQKFLENRLFWAFDAGRNCVWDNYQESKKRVTRLEELLKAADLVIDAANTRNWLIYVEAIEAYNKLKNL